MASIPGVETKALVSMASNTSDNGTGTQVDDIDDDAEGDSIYDQATGGFTPEFVEEMKEVFSLFDFTGSGHIASEDLGTVIRGLGMNLTEHTIHECINKFDKDGSGKLDFATFHTLLLAGRPMPPPARPSHVVDCFRVFDIYRDGHISAEDLHNMLRTLGEPLSAEDVDHLLTEIVIDGDGRVNIEHFVEHMHSTSLPR